MNKSIKNQKTPVPIKTIYYYIIQLERYTKKIKI